MADEKPTKKVLMIRRHPRSEFVPLMSRDLDDTGYSEEFLAVRIEEINKARHAGAVRPVFRITEE